MTTAWREEEEEDQPAPILSWLIKFSSLFSLPVLARRKHLLTHQLTDCPDWAQAGGGQDPPVLSVLRTADSQGEKSIINNIFISAYCPPSSVLRRCWHGRGRLTDAGEPTDCLGRVRSVILGGCWWWWSVPENCDSQCPWSRVRWSCCDLSLPPPYQMDTSGPVGNSMVSWSKISKLNWAALHHT